VDGNALITMEILMIGIAHLPFAPELTLPRPRLPKASCDCHFQVFEDVALY